MLLVCIHSCGYRRGAIAQRTNEVLPRCNIACRRPSSPGRQPGCRTFDIQVVTPRSIKKRDPVTGSGAEIRFSGTAPLPSDRIRAWVMRNKTQFSGERNRGVIVRNAAVLWHPFVRQAVLDEGSTDNSRQAATPRIDSGRDLKWHNCVLYPTRTAVAGDSFRSDRHEPEAVFDEPFRTSPEVVEPRRSSCRHQILL